MVDPEGCSVLEKAGVGTSLSLAASAEGCEGGRGHVQCAAETLLLLQNERHSAVLQLREPKLCEQCPTGCVGHRAGGSVGGGGVGEVGRYSTFGEKGAAESLEASSKGSTDCSPLSLPAKRGGG